MTRSRAWSRPTSCGRSTWAGATARSRPRRSSRRSRRSNVSSPALAATPGSATRPGGSRDGRIPVDRSGYRAGVTTSAQIRQATVDANGLTFGILEAGHGPLALCLHGFPDTAYTWQHLLPDLAAAGFHAVAPFMRGYAPTGIPADGAYAI